MYAFYLLVLVLGEVVKRYGAAVLIACIAVTVIAAISGGNWQKALGIALALSAIGLILTAIGALTKPW